MPKPEDSNLTYDAFLNVDIRVGRIVKAEPYPEARKPAYKVWVDFGPDIGELKTSAQITVHYTPEGLVGKLVAGVINFPNKQIGKFQSQFLLLGFPGENDAVVLIQPTHDIPLGGRLH